MTLYIVNASYKMSLEGCSLNGIADIFPQTSQIASGEPRLSFFTNNLYGELGIAEIRAIMVDYAQIDAML